jgi:hypothetical protein
MSLPDSVRSDLLIVCADAPALADRVSAHSLLARDMCATIRGALRDASHDPSHPAFRDLAEGAHGGPNAAQWYFTHPTGLAGGTITRGPLNPQASPQSLAPEFAAINAAAPPLISSVKTAMTTARFNAARRRLRGIPAAAAANFQLDWLLSWPTSQDITLAAGTWHVEFKGIGWTRNTAPGCDVTLSFVLNGGAPFATHSVARPVAPAGEAEVDQISTFDVADTVVVGSDSILTVNNSGAFEERLLGILRFYT